MNNEYINTFPFNPCEYPFNIEVAGIASWSSSFVVNRTDCYCYILEYIISGQGTLICNDQTYRLDAGDAYILPKGSTHCYYPNESWDKIWFNIDGVLVSSLICAYGLQDTIVFKGFNNQKLFSDLYEITNMKTGTKEIMRHAATQFHIILQHMHDFITETLPDSNINAIKEILDLSLYQGDISIKEISEKFCISQIQLIKMFKKVFNVTPYQYFSQKRINIAASMLTDSNMSVKEISEALHYADQPYFTNCFKKIMGCSPTEYRRKNKDVSSDANLNNKLFVEDNPFSSLNVNVINK